MSIRTRVVFAFSMLLALMVSQTAIAISQVGRLSDITEQATRVAMGRIEHASHMSTDVLELRAAELSLVLSGSSESKQTNEEKIAAARQSISEGVADYTALLDNPQPKGEYASFLAHYQDYLRIDQELANHVEGGRLANAQDLFSRSNDTFNAMNDLIHSVRHDEFANMQASSIEASQSAARSRYLFTFATGMVAAVELGLGIYIWRSLSGGFHRLLDGTRRVGRGELNEPVSATSRDEFGELARSFNAMMESLRGAQEENVRLTYEKLKMQEEHLALLRDRISRITRAQEDERQRIARELHDQAGQTLTALQLGLARLEGQVKTDRVREELESLRQLTIETMDEIRNLALDLRPSALDELGLVPALRAFSREYTRRFGTPITVDTSALKERLPAEMEVALFRIIQEALTNVAKHAKASHAQVTLRLVNSSVEAAVADDGRGFEVEQTMRSAERRSLGLIGMKERVELFGGSFGIKSQPGKGTTLTITLPLRSAIPSHGEMSPIESKSV